MAHVRRIAIIGGGPTGIACAKFFVAEKAFDTIDVFEQRDNVGGIWNLSNAERSCQIKVPQTNPRYTLDENDEDLTTSLEFESPLYDYLETNIPKPLMAYSDAPFDEALPLFPGHADVLRYLEKYAEPVKHLIHYRTRVVNLTPQPRHSDHRLFSQDWKLTTKDIANGQLNQRQYDAVVVANGHYTIPHVPTIVGLEDWATRYPGTVIHSKAYRRPEDFKNKRVLVIGNSASGLDIAAQLAPCALNPVFLASRSASQLAPTGSGPAWRKDIAEIEEFLDDRSNRGVRTKTGEVFDGFDAVIFATGYFYSFPFLSAQPISPVSGSESNSPSDSTTSIESGEEVMEQQASIHTGSPQSNSTLEPLTNLITSGLRTHNVYKHFLHTHYPTLAFPVLNLKIIPFPLAENQAAVLARIWSGRLNTPSQSEMQEWEKDEEQRLLEAHRLRPAPDTASGDSVATSPTKSASKGSKYEGGFHTLVYPEDANQLNSLYRWASSAKLDPSLENGGKGKLGTFWEERQVWLRGQFPNIKAAYAKRGADRTAVTSLDMLGDEWKYGFERWQESTPRKEQEELFRKAAVPGW